jgi:hypothetical protein
VPPDLTAPGPPRRARRAGHLKPSQLIEETMAKTPAKGAARPSFVLALLTTIR